MVIKNFEEFDSKEEVIQAFKDLESDVVDYISEISDKDISYELTDEDHEYIDNKIDNDPDNIKDPLVAFSVFRGILNEHKEMFNEYMAKEEKDFNLFDFYCDCVADFYYMVKYNNLKLNKADYLSYTAIEDEEDWDDWD